MERVKKSSCSEEVTSLVPCDIAILRPFRNYSWRVECKVACREPPIESHD